MSQMSEEKLEEIYNAKLLEEQNLKRKSKKETIKKNLIVAVVIVLVIFGASRVINKT